MNIAAKVLTIITVSAFCAVGVFASPNGKSHKNKVLDAWQNDELAFCVPEPVDVSSTLTLAQVDPDPTYTGK